MKNYLNTPPSYAPRYESGGWNIPVVYSESGIFFVWRDHAGHLQNAWFYGPHEFASWLMYAGHRFVREIIEVRNG